MDGTIELLALSDDVYERTRARLEGLTDDEYRWEPAPACWSIRARDDGEVRADWAPLPEEPPLTTIAWRLWHLTECYGQARNETMLRGSAGPGGDERCAPRANADDAVGVLATAHDWWRELLVSLSEPELSQPMGPVAGPYAESTRAAFVLHQIDEQVHHAAEVGVMRDLFRATGMGAAPVVDPALAAVLSGRRPGDGEVGRLRTERPDLVRWAAANGYWTAVPLLVELGFDAAAERDGATALHHAAAAGETDIARLLVERGADITRRDATFRATPAEWAAFYGREATAAELRVL